MAPRIGYLLPTREQIMAGQPQAAPLLDLEQDSRFSRLVSIGAKVIQSEAILL